MHAVSGDSSANVANAEEFEPREARTAVEGSTVNDDDRHDDGDSANMFSPRSTAAMALSSISSTTMQQHHYHRYHSMQQQTLFPTNESSSNEALSPATRMPPRLSGLGAATSSTASSNQATLSSQAPAPAQTCPRINDSETSLPLVRSNPDGVPTELHSRSESRNAPEEDTQGILQPPPPGSNPTQPPFLPPYMHFGGSYVPPFSSCSQQPPPVRSFPHQHHPQQPSPPHPHYYNNASVMAVGGSHPHPHAAAAAAASAMISRMPNSSNHHPPNGHHHHPPRHHQLNGPHHHLSSIHPIMNVGGGGHLYNYPPPADFMPPWTPPMWTQPPQPLSQPQQQQHMMMMQQHSSTGPTLNNNNMRMMMSGNGGPTPHRMIQPSPSSLHYSNNTNNRSQQQQQQQQHSVSWEHPPPPPMHYPQPSSQRQLPHNPHARLPPHGYFPPPPHAAATTMSGNVRPLHPGMTVTPTPHKKPKLDHDSGDVGVEPDEEESHTYVPPLPTVLPAPSSQCQKAVEPSPPLQPETVETIISATTPTTTTPSTTTSKPKYNRKNKSLGILAESFLAKFAGSEECREIVIDQLAYELAVERRRIYDVVNILEALQVVVKMGKNTYHWMGREHLSRQFALLQNEGFELWPDFAESRGLVVPDHTTNNNINHPAVPMPDNSTHTTVSPKQVSPSSVNNNKENTCTNNNNNKSLTRLSQLFLQVFLVGLDPVNLPQASDLIHGGRSTPDELVSLGMKLGDDYPTDAKKFKQAAARGLKTKIRRLYDIANVFVSVGLLRKSENRTAATTDGKRPHFHWNYGLDVRQIRAIWDMLPLPMKNEKSPFNEAQARMLNTDGNCKTNFFGVYVPPPPTSSVGSSSSKASAMSCLNEFLQGNGTEQRAVATTTGLLPPASDDSSTSQDEQAEACSPSVDDDEGNPSHRSDTFLRRVSLPPTRADWK